MAIGKRTRFEVFKRDKFRCIYCGRTPPDVILEADHVIPVSAGGLDVETNLVTACFDCNRGKANLPLNSIPRGHMESLEKRRESLEQLKAFNELTIEEEKNIGSSVEQVSDLWIRLLGLDPEEDFIESHMETSVRMFLRKLPLRKVLEAVEITFRKFVHRTHSSDTRFRYFCGICWNMIERSEMHLWDQKTSNVLEETPDYGCGPHVNQHTETPAKPSEVLPSNGSLPEEQARPGESSAFQRAAPERHSGDCQLPTKQRPSDLRLYR